MWKITNYCVHWKKGLTGTINFWVKRDIGINETFDQTKQWIKRVGPVFWLQWLLIDFFQNPTSNRLVKTVTNFRSVFLEVRRIFIWNKATKYLNIKNYKINCVKLEKPKSCLTFPTMKNKAFKQRNSDISKSCRKTYAFISPPIVIHYNI